MITQSIQSLMNASGVRFGTSGVRGLVSALSPELCFAYTLAFLQVINAKSGSRVAIAMDLRPSSPDIAAACATAAKHLGVEVDFCGALPTPALAYYAQTQNIPGIMVTGSHIPFDRNGIKFYGHLGEITKEDERAITNATISLPDEISISPLPKINQDARKLYIKRYLNFFHKKSLIGMRVAFYEHSSVARDLLPEVLEALGATTVSLGRSDVFVPIDTEAVSLADVEQARKWAETVGFDAIISTDGDADRPLIGDELGNWLRGDVVGLLCAEALGAKSVVTPVSSNTAIELSGYFSKVVRTRVGSPYVIEAMSALIADGDESVVGFEANGGFLQGTLLERDGSALAALMTRDATLPIIAILSLANTRKYTVSQLLADLPARYTASDRLLSIPTASSVLVLKELALSMTAIGNLLVGLGGHPVAIDQTDGLRIFLDNGEIVHFRSSGNAPELRCYAEANNQARANWLASECLRLIGFYNNNFLKSTPL